MLRHVKAAAASEARSAPCCGWSGCHCRRRHGKAAIMNAMTPRLTNIITSLTISQLCQVSICIGR
jgi:hypothetical protein